MKALITPEAMRHPDGPYCRILERGGFEVGFLSTPEIARGGHPPEALIEELQGYSAVIASGEFYDDAVLDGAPQLRVVARAGVGYDRVDVPACTRRRIAVTITPQSNREAVAELTFALMFALAKRLVVNDRRVRDGHWDRRPLSPIRGRTLGIVGLGRIGRAVAERARALGMSVLACDEYPDLEFARQHDVSMVELSQLLADSDYVAIHCPLNDQTTGLFNRDVFQQMKPGSAVINMARGPILVERDLVEALESGHLSGAALDVFEQEPPNAGDPLFQRDDVVVSPHMGGVDELSIVGMGVEAAEAIVQLSRNDWPEAAAVNHELKSDWKW